MRDRVPSSFIGSDLSWRMATSGDEPLSSSIHSTSRTDRNFEQADADLSQASQLNVDNSDLSRHWRDGRCGWNLRRRLRSPDDQHEEFLGPTNATVGQAATPMRP